MLITPSFKKSLIVEQFQGNYLNDFNRSVEDILSTISFENKLSYIMGYFDINILNSHSCSKRHHSSKPWFSNGLFTSCKKKNSLYKQFQLNPIALNKLRYNTYRNKYNFLSNLPGKNSSMTNCSLSVQI